MQINKLHEAFGHRAKPVNLIRSKELSEDEIAGIHAVGKFKWDELPLEVLEKNFDAITLMSPEAFVYYLPGVILASIREGVSNSISAVALISMLDRTPSRELWDSYFHARWSLLRVSELNVVSEWILWIDNRGDFSLEELSLIRALENLDLLRAGAAVDDE